MKLKIKIGMDLPARVSEKEEEASSGKPGWLVIWRKKGKWGPPSRMEGMTSEPLKGGSQQVLPTQEEVIVTGKIWIWGWWVRAGKGSGLHFIKS